MTTEAPSSDSGFVTISFNKTVGSDIVETQIKISIFENNLEDFIYNSENEKEVCIKMWDKPLIWWVAEDKIEWNAVWDYVKNNYPESDSKWLNGRKIFNRIGYHELMAKVENSCVVMDNNKCTSIIEYCKNDRFYNICKINQ